jgi:O-methyltransferase
MSMRSGFPFNMFDPQWLAANGGETGQRIAQLAPLSLYPPYPWGQWIYGRLLQECGTRTGDFVECGVALGGMSIFLGGYARSLGRKLYALDSFCGLPPPDPARDNPYFRVGDYAAAAESSDLLARFRAVVHKSGLAETVIPISGFFETSLDQLPIDRTFTFVHVDVDLFHSTRLVLERLFPSIAEGGILVIDDFFHHSQGPARAASEYFASVDYSPLYHVAFPYSVVVMKGEPFPVARHRGIDGNCYSFDLLRNDPIFQQALLRSLQAAEASNNGDQTAKAHRLRELLAPGRPDTSADIYEYWYALNDFWDFVDASNPKSRQSITL